MMPFGRSIHVTNTPHPTQSMPEIASMTETPTNDSANDVIAAEVDVVAGDEMMIGGGMAGDGGAAGDCAPHSPLTILARTASMYSDD